MFVIFSFPLNISLFYRQLVVDGDDRRPGFVNQFIVKGEEKSKMEIFRNYIARNDKKLTMEDSWSKVCCRWATSLELTEVKDLISLIDGECFMMDVSLKQRPYFKLLTFQVNSSRSTSLSTSSHGASQATQPRKLGRRWRDFLAKSSPEARSSSSRRLGRVTRRNWSRS